MIRLAALTLVALGALLRTQVHSMSNDLGGGNGYSVYLASVNAAPALQDLFFTQSRNANYTHSSARNFRSGIVRIHNVD